MAALPCYDSKCSFDASLHYLLHCRHVRDDWVSEYVFLSVVSIGGKDMLVCKCCTAARRGEPFVVKAKKFNIERHANSEAHCNNMTKYGLNYVSASGDIQQLVSTWSDLQVAGKLRQFALVLWILLNKRPISE